MIIDEEGNIIILPEPDQEPNCSPSYELHPGLDPDPEFNPYSPLPDPRSNQGLYKQFESYKLRPKQHAYLCAYVEACGVPSLAWRSTGISKSTHYRWLAEEPNYAEAFKLAQKMAVEELERIATLRAAFGTKEPHWHQNNIVGYKVKYSDTLMVKLLEGNMPDKYKTRVAQEISNKAGEVFRLDPGREKLTDEALDTLISMAEKAKNDAQS